MPHSDKYLINNSSAVVKANYPRPPAPAKSCSCSSWSAQRPLLLATACATSPVVSNVHPGSPAPQPGARGRLIQTFAATVDSCRPDRQGITGWDQRRAVYQHVTRLLRKSVLARFLGRAFGTAHSLSASITLRSWNFVRGMVEALVGSHAGKHPNKGTT